MARTNDPNSATSQFFVNLVDNAFLDPGRGGAGYAVFGCVTEGMDVVDKIAAVKTGNKSRPPGRARHAGRGEERAESRAGRLTDAAHPGRVTVRTFRWRNVASAHSGGCCAALVLAVLAWAAVTVASVVAMRWIDPPDHGLHAAGPGDRVFSPREGL